MNHILKINIILFGIIFNSNAQLKINSDSLKIQKTNNLTNYYVEAGSYGTKRESNPPSYVRNLSEIGIKKLEKFNFLDIGFDFRTRFEIRKNDIRRDTLMTDMPILFKTRAYLGIKNIIDPFRFAIEYQDASRENGFFKEDDRDYNRSEFIQMYAELFFKKALGTDKLGNNRPIFLRFGRQHFEFLDKRLIGSNQWRNTTNTFIGFRASLGGEYNDFQVDLLALRPLKRVIHEFDRTDFYRDFGAVIGHLRLWSKVITIEPYYLALNQRASLATGFKSKMIHSPGLRLYGIIFKSKFNYDFTGTNQFGNDQGLIHKAKMYTAEIGYKFISLKSKPKISVFYGFASGDKDPFDKVNNRFERFYGFSRPWSSDDYIVPENIITIKMKFEFEPIKGFKIDFGYSMFYLASKTDRFNNFLNGNSNNRDKFGLSGNKLGHGFDSRFRYSLSNFFDLNVGYNHFTNGNFVLLQQNKALGESKKSSDFIYFELTINVFDLFKR